MRRLGSLGPGPGDSESSGVPNTMHSHGPRNDQNAFLKIVLEVPGAHSKIGPLADWALGPEPPKLCMSLWQKLGSQGPVMLRTPELSQHFQPTSLDALEFNLETRDFGTYVI